LLYRHHHLHSSASGTTCTKPCISDEYINFFPCYIGFTFYTLMLHGKLMIWGGNLPKTLFFLTKQDSYALLPQLHLHPLCGLDSSFASSSLISLESMDRIGVLGFGESFQMLRAESACMEVVRKDVFGTDTLLLTPGFYIFPTVGPKASATSLPHSSAAEQLSEQQRPKIQHSRETLCLDLYASLSNNIPITTPHAHHSITRSYHITSSEDDREQRVHLQWRH
jgi:hypothetical protein